MISIYSFFPSNNKHPPLFTRSYYSSDRLFHWSFVLLFVSHKLLSKVVSLLSYNSELLTYIYHCITFLFLSLFLHFVITLSSFLVPLLTLLFSSIFLSLHPNIPCMFLQIYRSSSGERIN